MCKIKRLERYPDITAKDWKELIDEVIKIEQNNVNGNVDERVNALTKKQEELLKEINRGLEVEQITRITGYFTKISQWNKGKRGELKDRVRVDEL